MVLPWVLPGGLLGLLGAASSGCPQEWMATCPSVPCTPNPHPPPSKELLGWRARWSTPTADAGPQFSLVCSVSLV
eukprot:SAG31_NODE_1897_length_6964_cov_2.677349_9_plen_75_part_00